MVEAAQKLGVSAPTLYEWRKGRTAGRSRVKPAEQKRNTVATLQQWFRLLMAEGRGEARLCFRCVHEVAKETKAEKRAYLSVTVLRGERC